MADLTYNVVKNHKLQFYTIATKPLCEIFLLEIDNKILWF